MSNNFQRQRRCPGPTRARSAKERRDLEILPKRQSQSLTLPPKKRTLAAVTVKRLPTIRAHTSGQLNDEGDEYHPNLFDDAGEAKIDTMGNLKGDLQYKVKTFKVPNRGSKMFMLAKECSRVLGYRDTPQMFRKNPSLYKVKLSKCEKTELFCQQIISLHHRSHEVLLVTAKSMFRQFGSRVILNGRRVRDDYFEAHARKQGFTENDKADCTRPGAINTRHELAKVTDMPSAAACLQNGAISRDTPQGILSSHRVQSPVENLSQFGKIVEFTAPVDDQDHLPHQMVPLTCCPQLSGELDLGLTQSQVASDGLEHYFVSGGLEYHPTMPFNVDPELFIQST